jgi:hypothetical protein
MNDTFSFVDRELFIVSKHRKEKVIAPLMFESFGITCFIDPLLDTDQFGTFSGEKERVDDVITTLRKKCQLAHKYENVDLILASEGSFGPHPELFFTSVNEETLMLSDRRNNLEFIAKVISTETNFAGSSITDLDELVRFADRIGFPEHAIILRNAKDSSTFIKKGIVDRQELESAFLDCMKHFNSVFVETDMRAMSNPSRMKVIEICTQKLIDLMRSDCPNCKTPGFQVVELRSGLPCMNCGLPTRSTKSKIFGCQHCEFKKEELYPNGKQTEDPMYCDFCNP